MKSLLGEPDDVPQHGVYTAHETQKRSPSLYACHLSIGSLTENIPYSRPNSIKSCWHFAWVEESIRSPAGSGLLVTALNLGELVVVAVRSASLTDTRLTRLELNHLPSPTHPA